MLINKDALILNGDALAHALTSHAVPHEIRRFLHSTTTDHLHTLLPTRHSGTDHRNTKESGVQGAPVKSYFYLYY